MKQIVSVWRLTLRKILAALMGAVPFLLVGCPLVEYGPGPDPYPDRMSGTVKDNENHPVPGFGVSLQTKKYNSYTEQHTYRTYSTLTDENGTFKLFVYESPPYTVFFEDVDGPLNGEFDSQTVQWTSGDGHLNIVLVPKN
jgi:putative lipoprotein (rSAM/lipoprotein system)